MHGAPTASETIESRDYRFTNKRRATGYRCHMLGLIVIRRDDAENKERDTSCACCPPVTPFFLE